MAPRASLFGKLPTALDYVRIRLDGPAAIAFDTFTQQAIQELARANAEWPAGFVRFLFAPGGGEALVGVMVRSRDRAGRKFPVSVFATLSASAASRSFAAIPLAWESFLQGAEALLESAPNLSKEALAEQLDGLTPPSDGELNAQGRTISELLAERSVEAFAQSVGGEATLDARAACENFIRAAQTARSNSNERGGALDCPVGEQADVLTWLALAQRTLSSSLVAPSFFWHVSHENSRLLFTLGAPPALLPVWLSDPARRHAKLTSLRGSYAPPPSDTASGPSTLSELFDALIP
jgi:type VI secretion system protein ImpM